MSLKPEAETEVLAMTYISILNRTIEDCCLEDKKQGMSPEPIVRYRILCFQQ